MKKLLYILPIIFSITLVSQMMDGDSKQRILIGEVKTDDGKMIDCEIEVIDPLGKKFVIKTLDGKFEQVLDAKKDYKFTFVGDALLRDMVIVNVDNPDKDFTPAKQTFTVTKLAVGKTLKGYDLFEDGSAELKPGAQKTIDAIKLMLKFNRSIKVDLICSGEGGLAEKRANSLKEFVKKDRRFGRSANIKSDERADKSIDVLLVVSKVIDRMK